ncbi:hypothetical protein RND81_09G150200 [Saponaria officinalis]|uniref:Translation initiation factor 3 N-terminal domain-containing protein n=1 Tax=Saponaria officinalis TaxID=3572 RepID=A0AAW1ILW4_SAPOF
MALLSRIKEVKSNNIFNYLKRSYFQIHNPRLLTNYTLHNPNSDYYHCFRFTNTLNNQTFYGRHEGFIDSRVRFFAAPVQVVTKKVEVKQLNRPRLNDEITAEFVRLVTDEGHSVVSRREAQQRAKELSVDLVEVDPNAKPPVCRVMDYHREMYKKQVKGKEKAKMKSAGSLRKSACKEVRISAKAELKDIKIKIDTVKRMMERGYRVKCTALAAEGRDPSALLAQMSALLEDVAFVEFGPKLDEKQGYVIVRHIKFGPSKKGNKSSKISTPSNSETQTESSASSVSTVDSEESAMDDDDEDSDLELDDEVKTPLHKASTFAQPQAPNFVPDVGPVSQPENRYARKTPNNASPVRNPVRLPYSGTQPPPGFPPGGPRQARGDISPSRNSWPRQNENPSQPRGEIPNGGRQSGNGNNFSPYGGHPTSPTFIGNDSSKSSSFNLFSGAKSNDGDFETGVARKPAVRDNVNPATSKSDGGAAGDNKKWGIFSGEDSLSGRKG